MLTFIGKYDIIAVQRKGTIMKRIKKILIFLISVVLSLALLCCFIGVSLSALDYYVNKKITVLYSDETTNGHSIRIYERGRNLLQSYHYLTLEIDGKESLRFVMMSEEQIYPKEHITCARDDATHYELNFNEPNIDIFLFDSDFKKIYLIQCWNLEIIDNSIKPEDNAISQHKMPRPF